MVGEGWGGVYVHMRGPNGIPAEASWRHKPPGRPLDELLADVADEVPVWRRQMVLGPAPELCIDAGGPPRRSVVPLSTAP